MPAFLNALAISGLCWRSLDECSIGGSVNLYPVSGCGSDGQVKHIDLCQLKYKCCTTSKQINVLYEGISKPIEVLSPPLPLVNDCDVDTPCTGRDKPVCGSDGITYTNACLLRRASCNNPNDKIKLVREGPCECLEPCTGIDKPVCASDGITYTNACLLRRASCSKPNDKIELVKEGPC